MRISIEVKEEDKVTTYTADLTKLGKAVEKVGESVNSFLEKTFGDVLKKETFTREK